MCYCRRQVQFCHTYIPYIDTRVLKITCVWEGESDVLWQSRSSGALTPDIWLNDLHRITGEKQIPNLYSPISSSCHCLSWGSVFLTWAAPYTSQQNELNSHHSSSGTNTDTQSCTHLSSQGWEVISPNDFDISSWLIILRKRRANICMTRIKLNFFLQ